jgi:2-methylisocitrate lyase-like PEP mutase family enzyme
MSAFARFAALHVPGDPLVLHNVWDAGSARAVASAGAPAIATGSWSVAAAYGVEDGEALPLDDALANARRIVRAVDVPVTIDFEGGYAVEPTDVAANVARLAGTGVVGCNLEDQIVGGEGMHPTERQAARIAAVRGAVGADFFLNARTDLFLQTPAELHASLVDEAIARGRAYAEAGASGFFVPGLIDPDPIGRIAAAVPLPLNVMAVPGGPDRAAFAGAGVARVSHGPFPYRRMLAWLATKVAG